MKTETNTKMPGIEDIHDFQDFVWSELEGMDLKYEASMEEIREAIKTYYERNEDYILQAIESDLSNDVTAVLEEKGLIQFK